MVAYRLMEIEVKIAEDGSPFIPIPEDTVITAEMAEECKRALMQAYVDQGLWTKDIPTVTITA